jgi:hypothetical protein
MHLKGLSIQDFALNICDYLIKNDIKLALSGGACVAIYTDNKYMSYDLDFVLISDEKQKKIKHLLLEIGFYEDGMFYKHLDSQYFLHFLSPPLSIGDEPVTCVHEIKKGGLLLRLLSPTDCARDRLAAYYYWDDRQSLEQAIMVARDQKVNFSEIKRWSIRENQYEKFKIFLKTINAK